MGFTIKDIAYIAKLARLELSEDEIEQFSSELSKVVDYFNQLALFEEEEKEIKTLPSVLERDDNISVSLSQEIVLSLFPSRIDNFLVVPKVRKEE